MLIVVKVCISFESAEQDQIRIPKIGDFFDSDKLTTNAMDKWLVRWNSAGQIGVITCLEHNSDCKLGSIEGGMVAEGLKFAKIANIFNCSEITMNATTKWIMSLNSECQIREITASNEMLIVVGVWEREATLWREPQNP